MAIVNIVIPAYNQLEYTKQTIEHILQNTAPGSYVLHVVNNASMDGTYEYLEKLKKEEPGIIIYHNKHNLGYAGGNNTALRNITDGHVLFLNNDVLPTPGWLDRLLHVLDANPDAGMIVPVSNAASGGPQQISGLSLKTNRSIIAYADNAWAVNSASTRICKTVLGCGTVIGFCMLVRDVVYKQVGQMDEIFNVGAYEDIDYCMRVERTGYNIKISDGCFLYHYGSTTISARNKEKSLNYQYIMYINAEKLKYKQKCNNPLCINSTYVRDQVAVIIPCFNHGEYIDECVGSVLKQTYQNFEIVIVDDGSSDSTIERVKAQAAKDNRIKVLFNKVNSGPAASRTTGILNSSSEFILPLDADDKIAANCLEKMVDAIQLENDIVCCGWIDYWEDGREVCKLPVYNINEIMNDNCMTATSMFRRVAFDVVGSYSSPALTSREDWDFWLSLIEAGFERVYCVKDYLLYYRHYGKSRNTAVESTSFDMGTITSRHSLLAERLKTRPKFVDVSTERKPQLTINYPPNRTPHLNRRTNVLSPKPTSRKPETPPSIATRQPIVHVPIPTRSSAVNRRIATVKRKK